MQVNVLGMTAGKQCDSYCIAVLLSATFCSQTWSNNQHENSGEGLLGPKVCSSDEKKCSQENFRDLNKSLVCLIKTNWVVS